MRIRVWLCLAVLAGPARAGELAPDSLLFPRPVALTRAVEFWKQVFTRYGTDQAILHDDEDLGLVYGVEGLGSRADTRQEALRRQAREAILARYQQALERLARGVEDTSGLAPVERRVWLALGRSAVPLRYQQARERLRLQVGQQDRFERGWLAWVRHGEKIRRILRGHGVPDSLAVLPFVESMFDGRARSHAGAVGLWQITRPAGRRFLRIDEQADERLDPLRATHAAAQILAHNRRVLGNWPLAITAYNHGTAGVARAVREVGSRDIDELVRRYQGPAFGFASRNFYAEFLAALEVVDQRHRRAGQQVLAAAGVSRDEWAVADSVDTTATALHAAIPVPVTPVPVAVLTAVVDSAATPSADASAGRAAGGMDPAQVALHSGAPDSSVAPVAGSFAGSAGWWEVLRFVLSPFRVPERDYLYRYVALFEWIQGCKRAFSAFLGPRYV